MTHISDSPHSDAEEPVYSAIVDSPPTQLPNSEPVIHTISGKPIERLTRAKQVIGDQYWTMLAFCFLGVIVGSMVPFGLLMGPVMCGLHICYHECRAGRRVEMDHLMKGADYFGDSLIAMLIIVLLSSLITIPIFVIAVISFIVGGVMLENGGPAAILFVVSALFYVLGLVASVMVHVLFVFTFPLIVDRKLSGVEAVKLSAKAARKNFLAVTWFLMGNMLSSMLAAMLCYVPAILLMPLNFGATFELYYEVFGDDKKLPAK